MREDTREVYASCNRAREIVNQACRHKNFKSYKTYEQAARTLRDVEFRCYSIATDHDIPYSRLTVAAKARIIQTLNYIAQQSMKNIQYAKRYFKID